MKTAFFFKEDSQIICNTLCSTESDKIGHWVAISHSNNKVDFFDPLGRSFEDQPPAIKFFIDYCKEWNIEVSLVADVPLQSEGSVCCGEYCVCFLNEISLGKKAEDICASLKSVTSAAVRDEVVCNYVKVLNPITSPAIYQQHQTSLQYLKTGAPPEKVFEWVVPRVEAAKKKPKFDHVMGLLLNFIISVMKFQVSLILRVIAILLVLFYFVLVCDPNQWILKWPWPPPDYVKYAELKLYPQYDYHDDLSEQLLNLNLNA